MSVRLSHRILCLMGTVTASLSLILQQLSPNVYVFMVTFGILGGTGMLVMQYASMAVLGMYFKEKLSLASGLAFMGSSCGQLVIPQLFEYLLQQYNLRGALLLLGGCGLHVCVAAMLLRPAEFYKKASTTKHKPENVQVSAISIKQIGEGSSNPAFHISETEIEITEVTEKSQNGHKPVVNCECAILEKDINTSPDTHQTETSSSSDSPTDVQTDTIPEDAQKSPSLREKYWILCRSPSFHVFTMGRMFAGLFFYLVVMYFPVYVASLGYSSSQVALMLTIIGACDLPARPLHGWLTSFPVLDATVYCGVMTLAAGAIITLGVLWPTLPWLLTICVTTGLLISCISCLLVVLLKDMVGRRLIDISVPLIMTPMQIAMLFIPTVFGVIYDSSGSYQVPMLIVAGFGVTSGLITVLEKCKRAGPLTGDG